MLRIYCRHFIYNEPVFTHKIVRHSIFFVVAKHSIRDLIAKMVFQYPLGFSCVVVHKRWEHGVVMECPYTVIISDSLDPYLSVNFVSGVYIIFDKKNSDLSFTSLSAFTPLSIKSLNRIRGFLKDDLFL